MRRICLALLISTPLLSTHAWSQLKAVQNPHVAFSVARIHPGEKERVTIPLRPDWQKPLVDVPVETALWSTALNFEFGKDRGELPMINDLEALHPYFRDQIKTLIARCKRKGIELRVVETYRTRAKQQEYYAMGRKYTRSNGGKSKHQFGLAVDLVPIVKGEPSWDNKYLWRKIGVIGESLGLRWGGRWRTLYDPGHFEWTGGLSSSQLAQGQLPRIPKSHAYPCVEEDLTELQHTWEYWERHQGTVSLGQPTASTNTTGRPASK